MSIWFYYLKTVLLVLHLLSQTLPPPIRFFFFVREIILAQSRIWEKSLPLKCFLSTLPVILPPSDKKKKTYKTPRWISSNLHSNPAYNGGLKSGSANNTGSMRFGNRRPRPWTAVESKGVSTHGRGPFSSHPSARRIQRKGASASREAIFTTTTRNLRALFVPPVSSANTKERGLC